MLFHIGKFRAFFKYFVGILYTTIILTVIGEIGGGIIYEGLDAISVHLEEIKIESWTFWPVIIHQIIGLGYGTSAGAFSDAYSALILSLICGYIQGISVMVQEIGWPDDDKNHQKNSDDTKKLIECFKMYQKAFQLMEIFNKMYSKILLIQHGLSTITICLVMVKLSIDSPLDNPGLYFRNFFFIFYLAFEIYMIDFMGSELIRANEDLRNAIYSINWPRRDLEFKKYAIIVNTNEVTSENWTFWVLIANQIVTLSYSTCAHIFSDGYSVLVLALICGYVKGIAETVKEIGWPDPILKTSNKAKKELENQKQLIECIKMHQKAFDLTQQLNRLFSKILVVQHGMSTITNCLVMVILSIDSPFDNPELYFRNSILIFTLAFEIYMIDFMGSELIKANEELKNAIYCINWPERDMKFKKIMIMFQQRSQYFIELKIGYLFNVDLVLFRKFHQKFIFPAIMSTILKLILLLNIIQLTFCSDTFDLNENKIEKNFNRGKIIGGIDAEKDEFPFIASLTKRGRHFCGASIVNERFLLTAGHCLCSGTNKIMKPSSFKATIGLHRQPSNNFKASSYQVSIKSITVHPKYVCDNVQNDIALLELSEPLNLDKDQISSLPLQSTSITANDNHPATVMGWGWDNEDVTLGNKPEILQKASITVISNEKCQKSYQENNKENIISETQMCAGRLEGGVDACWADSGGPLIDENRTLIGIVSTGVGCGRPGLPGIYTRVFMLPPAEVYAQKIERLDPLVELNNKNDVLFPAFDFKNERLRKWPEQMAAIN
uniref:CSON008458 protein n=1 Tax=Culicoides sonorensis TaxID=179676 RepID=A0A336LPC6_CULSO